jgi:NAD(P)H dehydrogenase (quinone)
VIPEHLVVIGSGVTGIEFVHMFASLGSAVTLIVSRQQVLPAKDPEVAAALETDFLARGVRLCIGARAVGIDRRDGSVAVRCDDGRVVEGSHALICVGSVPSSDGLGLSDAGVVSNDDGYVPVNHHCQTNVPHIYAAGDLSGRLPLASVAAVQGHKVAEHVMGLHTRQHRHLVSDPATGVVLGGSIVGAHAAEIVSVIALAVTANLRVTDLAERLFVHPALAEALAEAAE